MTSEHFLLTPSKLREYLAAQELVGDAREVSIRELGGGVSNLVFLIEGPERRWVAKQSLAKLRVKDDWRSGRERIYREAEAIQALAPALAKGELPEVVAIDRENYFFIMTAAPPDSAVWKDSLLRGEVDLDVAVQAGRYLARMIAASRASPLFRTRFEDRKIFDELRLDPYYRTVARRHRDLAKALDELITDSLKIQTSLVHGDFSPKNMLVRGDDIFLIDFEVVHWGDPAFDAGFLLNHLFLKAFHQPQFAGLYFDAAREFWKELLAGLTPEVAEGFEPMTQRHLGALMLARIDGKSPVEYIRDPETKERVRRAAKRLIRVRPEHLEEALVMVRS